MFICSASYLQRKSSNGEVMQRKLLVYSAGKIGYFAFVVSIFPLLMPRYPLIGFLTGLMLVCAWLSMKIPVVTYRQVFHSLRLSKD